MLFITFKINKNNVFDSFIGFIENYRNWTFTLDPAQLVALTNIIWYWVILDGVFTLIIILLGDYIINLFNLKTRFPKLVKLIEWRQRISKRSLQFNLLFLIIVIIIGIIVNIYMLLAKYFL